MNYYKSHLYTLILGVLVALLFSYLVFNNFRTAILSSNVDPDVVVGLITSLALLVSIKQWARDKNFTYRLAVKSKFEDMGHLVIAKLYDMDVRRQVCVTTLENIKKLLGTGIEYRDGNNITSTQDFNSDNCSAVAALDVYFPKQSEKWNEAIEILNEMGSLASTAFLNYSENDCGRNRTQFLLDIDKHLKRIRELNKQMGEKPKEIRDGVIDEINKHTLNLTKV